MHQVTEQDRAEVGAEISTKLAAVEDAIQRTMELAADFNVSLATAPRRARLATGYGQGVISRAAQVLLHLSEARGAVVLAHTGLERIQTVLGVKLDYDSEPFSTPPPKETPPMGMAEVISLEREVA